MARADELRAALRVAELEDELTRLKDGEESPELTEVKHELRYARWVQRGGPAEEQTRLDDEEIGEHTNRAVAAHFDRWLGEQAEAYKTDDTEMVG